MQRDERQKAQYCRRFGTRWNNGRRCASSIMIRMTVTHLRHLECFGSKGRPTTVKKQIDEAIEELSLMLLYLTRFRDNNKYSRYMEMAWTGYDFDTLRQLEDSDMIIQSSKHKYAYLTEEGKRRARKLLEEYQISDQGICEDFEFRNIRLEEAGQAAAIENQCALEDEKCTEQELQERIAKAGDLFLAAVEKQPGKIVGFVSGITTAEHAFRREFFTNADLHDPKGRIVMALGVRLLPEYENKELERELLFQFLRMLWEKERYIVLLMCPQQKVKMYKAMGFRDNGIADTPWGEKMWHKMGYVVR